MSRSIIEGTLIRHPTAASTHVSVLFVDHWDVISQYPEPLELFCFDILKRQERKERFMPCINTEVVELTPTIIINNCHDRYMRYFWSSFATKTLIRLFCVYTLFTEVSVKSLMLVLV